MRIKNWEKFQHFKDRTPPWIKLYRYLLDDPDWHELDAKAAKVLVMLWLVASEDESKEGKLPCLRKLAFRLRMKESELSKEIQRLGQWLYHDDTTTISNRYRDDAPETETETETETECVPPLISKPKRQKNTFIPPTELEVVSYFQENGFSTAIAKKAFAYYDAGGWKDSAGKPVKNWKQKMIAVWFKDENRAAKPQDSYPQPSIEELTS
jgi:hypothetical protein